VNPDNPVIGTRSFGEDQDLVSRFGAKYIEGLKQGKILSVAKHFPGHGDTDVDSHLDLPVIGHDMKRLEAVELKPFRAAIRHDVDGIMVSHVAVTSVDPSGLPSSLSEVVVTGLLRRKMAFPGLVITDSLGMKAVSNKYEIEEAAVKAIEAGNDMMLGCNSVETAIRVRSSIVEKAKRDSAFLKKLRISTKRIFSSKDAKLGNFRKPNLSVVGCQSHRREIARMVEKSVNIPFNDGILPLKENDRVAFFVPSDVSDYAPAIKGSISRHLSGIEKRVFEQDDPNFRDNALISRASRFDAFVIFSMDLHKRPEQASLVSKLVKNLLRITVVAINSPYDIGRIPRPNAFVVTHSPDPLSLDFAIRSMVSRSNK